MWFSFSQVLVPGFAGNHFLSFYRFVTVQASIANASHIVQPLVHCLGNFADVCRPPYSPLVELKFIGFLWNRFVSRNCKPFETYPFFCERIH